MNLQKHHRVCSPYVFVNYSIIQMLNREKFLKTPAGRCMFQRHITCFKCVTGFKCIFSTLFKCKIMAIKTRNTAIF